MTISLQSLEGSPERTRLFSALLSYLGTATGEMRLFLERLIFRYLVYDRERSSLFPKKIPTAFIHTMNSDESWAKEIGFDVPIRLMERILERIFGSSELFRSQIPCSSMIMQNMHHRHCSLCAENMMLAAHALRHWKLLDRGNRSSLR